MASGNGECGMRNSEWGRWNEEKREAGRLESGKGECILELKIKRKAESSKLKARGMGANLIKKRKFGQRPGADADR
jgi:hypothetical protein